MESFIIAGARTPIGRYGGALAGTRPDDLAALVVGEAVARAGVDPADVDEVVLGAANQAGEDNRNVARMAALLAGLPDSVPGFTVNRLCASGLTAVATARALIAAGDADLVVAGGVESMTRAPWVTEKPAGPWPSPGELRHLDRLAVHQPALRREHDPVDAADRRAGRPALEPDPERAGRVRAASHQRAVRRSTSGHFADEIVPVPATVEDTDEGPRPDTSLERLAGLRPVNGPGGRRHRRQLQLAQRRRRGDGDRQRGVRRAARPPAPGPHRGGRAPESPRRSWGSARCRPPEGARARRLDDGDLGAVELNEAFASQALACIRDLGLDSETVNADGGAIALGHPLGASGSRILLTLLGRLERTGAHRGLATMCVGVGQGTALLVERP